MTDHYALDDNHALHLARKAVRGLNYRKNIQVSPAKEIPLLSRGAEGIVWGDLDASVYILFTPCYVL